MQSFKSNFSLLPPTNLISVFLPLIKRAAGVLLSLAYIAIYLCPEEVSEKRTCSPLSHQGLKRGGKFPISISSQCPSRVFVLANHEFTGAGEVLSELFLDHRSQLNRSIIKAGLIFPARKRNFGLIATASKHLIIVCGHR